MEVIGETKDDAIGEAFDKCGKIMGYLALQGSLLDRLAQKGNPEAFAFPIPKMSGIDVSYSGIKTAFLNFINLQTQKETDFIKNNLVDLCASLQSALVKTIFEKINVAVKQKGINAVVLGGVSANSEIRKQLKEKEKTDRWKVYLPPFEYTTDNAAMIGMVGYLKAQENRFSDYTAVANPRLSF